VALRPRLADAAEVPGATVAAAAKARQCSLPLRPAESTGFFAPYGWRELEYRSHWDESLRLKRTMPHMWMWKILRWLQPRKRREAMNRFSGIILLEAN